MKKVKNLFSLCIAILMAFACTIGFTGCATNIKRMELTVQVYDYDNGSLNEYTMEIDLYGHLAPLTVDAISKYVSEHYYDNTPFYKLGAYGSQIMMGDLNYNDGEVTMKDTKPTLPGEFTYGGQQTIGGSALTAKKGTIGLWRSWYEQDGNYEGRNATDSGSATWFIPTQSISGYNDYFCIFAQYDLYKGDNEEVLLALASAFAKEENCVSYTIYYTGEDYENLQFNCVKSEDFNKDLIENLFEAEGDQLVCYNQYNVSFPVTPNGEIGARIVSAKIV